jgi:hypothetical protein
MQVCEGSCEFGLSAVTGIVEGLVGRNRVSGTHGNPVGCSSKSRDCRRFGFLGWSQDDFKSVVPNRKLGSMRMKKGEWEKIADAVFNI